MNGYVFHIRYILIKESKPSPTLSNASLESALCLTDLWLVNYNDDSIFYVCDLLLHGIMPAKDAAYCTAVKAGD